jgi:DNA gyrase subunit A
LKIALDNLDAVIQTIRESASAEAAFQTLQTRFTLSEIQARAILDMQLRRLAALERQQIIDEYNEILKTIAYLEDLLANPRKILYLVRDELIELRKKHGDERRTVVATDIGGDLSEEDLVPNDEVLVTISGRGYVKRLRSDTYRVQRRGGKGIRGQVLREEDALRHMVVANARDNILFFTNRGKVFQTKAYQIPEFDRTARGVPLINVIDLEPKDVVTAVLAAPDFENNEFLIMATRMGEIKKTSLHDFASVRRNGLIAMDLEPTDELCWVKHCPAGCEVMLVSEQGQALRFSVDVLRKASRSSGGVRGMRLGKGDRLAGMDVVDPQGQLLVVTELGMGKRTLLKHYMPHGRGTGGQKTLNITKKTGPVATAQVVHGDEELMMISASGIVIRTELSTISQQGRASQGVAVMNLKANDRVACIAVLNGRDDEEPEANEVTAAKPHTTKS